MKYINIAEISSNNKLNKVEHLNKIQILLYPSSSGG